MSIETKKSKQEPEKGLTSQETISYLNEKVEIDWYILESFFQEKGLNGSKKDRDIIIKKLSKKSPDELRDYYRFFSKFNNKGPENSKKLASTVLGMIEESLVIMKQQQLLIELKQEISGGKKIDGKTQVKPQSGVGLEFGVDLPKAQSSKHSPQKRQEDAVVAYTTGTSVDIAPAKKEKAFSLGISNDESGLDSGKERVKHKDSPEVTFLSETFLGKDMLNGYENYLEDINVVSASKVIVSTRGQTLSDKSSWEKAGYKCDGLIFGSTELRNVNNLKGYYESGVNPRLNERLDKLAFMEKNGLNIDLSMKTYKQFKNGIPNSLFEIMCDYDVDGKVNQKDNSILAGQQLLTLLTDLEGEIGNNLYVNIGKVLQGGGVDMKGYNPSKQGLYEFMKNNPQAKQVFRNQLETRATDGNEDIRNILMGSVKRSMDRRSSFEQRVRKNEGVEALETKVDAKLEGLYTEKLNRLKTNLNKLPQGDDKEKTRQVIQYLENNTNRRGILESARVSVIGGLLQAIKNHEGLGLGVGLESDELNSRLKAMSGDVIKSLSLDIGCNFNFASGNVLPGIGFHISYGGNMGESFKWFGKTGVMLIVPYTSIGIEGKINQSELRNAGFANFDTPDRSIGATAVLSLTGGGGMLHYKQDYLAGIESKKKEFATVMDKIFNIDAKGKSLKQIIDSLKSNFDKAGLKQEDKQYVSQIIINIEQSLLGTDFEKCTDQQKQDYINGIKNGYITNWEYNAIKYQESKGVRFSGVGIGLMLIAGFFPLPVLGITGTKVEVDYTTDKESETAVRWDLLSGVGQEGIRLGDNLRDFAKNYKEKYFKRMPIRISEVNGRLKFESTNNKDILDLINVNYNPAIAKEINYDGKSITVGNVGSINLFQKYDEKRKSYMLMFGAIGLENTNDLVKGDKSFSGNRPSEMDYQSMIAGTSTYESDTSILNGSNDISKELDKYIKTNLESIVAIPQSQGATYKKFKEELKSNRITSATDLLIKLIEKSEAKNALKGFVDTIKDLSTKVSESRKQGQENSHATKKLIYMVNQFNTAMMTDWETKDKLLSKTERLKMINTYIDQLYSKYSLSVSRSALEKTVMDAYKDPSKFHEVEKLLNKIDKEMLGKPNYPGISDHPGKKLEGLLRPVSDLIENRTKGFLNLASHEGLNGSVANGYRTRLIDKFGDKASFEPVQNDSSMIAFVGGYKLSADNKSRLSNSFDMTPPGLVSIAGGKKMVVDVTDETTKQWMRDKLLNSNYAKIMQESLNLSNNELRRLLSNDSITKNGKTVRLNTQYLFFLYGMCGNESFGMRFNGLTIDGIESGIGFNANGGVIVQKAEARESLVVFGVSFGEKKGDGKHRGGNGGSDGPSSNPTVITTQPPTGPTGEQ